MRMFLFALLAFLGCSAAANPESQLPAAARPAWAACREDVVRTCRERYSGDPQGSMRCEESEAIRYRDLTTDAQREQFLRERGCTSLPAR